ncbi:MAG TPA: hypothetical protein VEX15_03440 [Nocardioidaceae bacterium]|nr:hypothetical protein [Nocardioidaceae bacterium]
MFVQVIQGKVQDASQARAALDMWMQDLAPGAIGWLGSTAGVTDDGTFIALARFESESAARRNSERPEQDKWWGEASQAFSGDAVFDDSVAVDDDVVGDPDTAGFVQIMRGRASDPERARELMQQDPEAWRAFRPEVLASLSVGHQDGGFTTAIYFTSEAAAREGEQKEPPEAIKAAMEEMGSLAVGEVTYLDLKDPWLQSPR